MSLCPNVIRTRAVYSLLSLGLTAPLACVDARTAEPPCADYSSELAITLAGACGECHGAGDSFSAESYREVVGVNTSGERWVVAGDAESLLLTSVTAETHPPIDAAVVAELERWIVSCEAAYGADARAHAMGFASPTAKAFHGNSLAADGWDLTPCLDCHERPQASLSCETCHSGGATACDSCHGNTAGIFPTQPMKTSKSPFAAKAHSAHLLGGPLLATSIACESCHVVPEDFSNPGHVVNSSGGADGDGRAEVIFNDFAKQSPRAIDNFTPGYDPASGTCTVYCHGLASTPVTWESSNDPASCTICHELPPADGMHPQGALGQACEQCHGAVINAQGNFVDAALHLDGQVSLGDGSESCSACHGTRPDGAPPPDLSGSYETSGPVGVHSEHLTAGTFRGPVACADCHGIFANESFRAAVRTPGHIDDSDSGIRFAGLATANDAAPTYDTTLRTCSDSYCHGGGVGLIDDESADVNRDLAWDPADNGPVVCGSCHGLPPTVGTSHNSGMTRLDCSTCHGLVVDDAGDLIFDDADHTYHLNGNVEFNQLSR